MMRIGVEGSAEAATVVLSGKIMMALVMTIVVLGWSLKFSAPLYDALVLP